MVRALLAAGGVDVNCPGVAGCPALLRASSYGHTEIVRALLAVDGIDANFAANDGSTALILACLGGHTEIVRALLAVDGIDANHAENVGHTALTMASEDGHADIVHALLAVDGIDTNGAAADGYTALIHASKKGHAEIVRALLAVGGTDANLSTIEHGFSALMMAAGHGHASCARALVAANGISLNQQNPQIDNRAALHIACWKRNTELAELLLLAGGCRFLLDDGGDAPLDHAEGDKGVVAVFASGVDYWQRKRHRGHSRAMREAVTALLLARQHLGGRAAVAAPPNPPAQGRALRSTTARAQAQASSAPAPLPLPHLPQEIWLAVCCFLRSADFMP